MAEAHTQHTFLSADVCRAVEKELLLGFPF